MTESDITKTDCIKTECVIPKAAVLRWLLSFFPEIHQDAQLHAVQDTYQGGIKFTVHHTVQRPQPAGPILLEPPMSDVEDAELE